MITGINTVFEHGDKKFHLQAEDLGGETSSFEVRVYDKGSVVWQKRLSYEDLEAEKLPKQEYEQALRVRMEKTLLTVEAAIVKGKIGG